MTKIPISANIYLDTNWCFYFRKNEKGVTMKKIFSNVKKEMKKVKWPTKKDMLKYSVATISIIVFFCLFFVASDLIIMGIKELMK